MPDPAIGSKTVEIPIVPVVSTVTIPPVEVTVIGGMKDVVPTTGTVAHTTNPGAPNLIVTVITPFVAIVVRFAFMFAKSLLGFLTLSMIPAGSNSVMIAIHGMDFYHLILTGAGLSLAPTAYDLVQSLVTILGKLEQKYPVASGSV